MKGFLSRIITAAALALIYSGLAGHAPAADAGELDRWVAVSLQELDAQRGGFTTTGGMDISIGIERMVYVDGVLQAATLLNIPHLSAALSQPMLVQLPAMTQSGSGGIYTVQGLAALQSNLMTIIQNNQDHKVIDNFTVFNITASVLGAMREMNISSALNSQLSGALR